MFVESGQTGQSDHTVLAKEVEVIIALGQSVPFGMGITVSSDRNTGAGIPSVYVSEGVRDRWAHVAHIYTGTKRSSVRGWNHAQRLGAKHQTRGASTPFNSAVGPKRTITSVVLSKDGSMTSGFIPLPSPTKK